MWQLPEIFQTIIELTLYLDLPGKNNRHRSDESCAVQICRIKAGWNNTRACFLEVRSYHIRDKSKRHRVRFDMHIPRL